MAHTPSEDKPKASDTEAPALLLAEYDSAGDLLHAAEKVRDAGYTHWDTHSPFPIHGMDAAMGLPDSKLGLIVFPIGLAGTTLAFLMMWWMNGHDYPIWVSGKEPYAWPTTIPITFECMVLLSAFAAVFGMFGMNKLPRLHHPIFNHSTIVRATDDRFFLSIEATDPKFDSRETVRFLESLGGRHVELVED